MRLKDWLKSNKMSMKLFAKKLNLSYPYIYKYIKGSRRISHDTAIKIEQITGGDISREEALWPEQFNEDYVFNKNFYKSDQRRIQENETNI